MELILLKREYVTDLNESTTQWREYLFDPNDPDGAILENLVINSTAFEMTLGDLVWTNPLTGDTYTYDGDGGVTFTAGDGPIFTPPPPDLVDYGLRFVMEYKNWNQDTVREEIYKRDYVGSEEEVDGGGTPFSLNYENGGKVFVPFRGSRATLNLKSNVSKKFAELFDGDERDFYLIHKVNGTAKWTGWITPDNFTEVYGNAPFMTSVNFSDGIGMAKNLDFPDVNENGYTGTVSEKDAICAALRMIGLDLEVRIACNLTEDGMDELSEPIEQSTVNVETFTKDTQGEIVPLDCYTALEKMLKSWNAVMIQEDNIWWIVREPELYGSTLNYKRFNPDGTAIGTGSKSLENTFAGVGINLHRATLETVPAFKNIAVSQEYGGLLVPNNNFAINGDFNRWTPIYYDGGIRSWKLLDWTYVNLTPRIRIGGDWSGHVWRYEESTGLNETNNYINIYGMVTSFTDPAVGYLESKHAYVRAEVGNVIKVNFKASAGTSTVDQRLVEAYFNIAVKCGTKWLNWDEATQTLEWVSTETRIRWKIAEVGRWENISIPAIGIPEDGDLFIRLYQMVQLGSTSKVRYTVNFDDVELILADNPALLNQRIYYKTINDKTFTSKVEEIKIELGDVATVLSQNAKIVDGLPTAKWKRAAETSVPLAQLIAQEWVNQTNVSRYRLNGGECRTPLSFMATYEDAVNEAGRKFILSGGTYTEKDGKWKPDFHEIDQTEVSITIRAVTEESTTSQGAARPGNEDGYESPEAPTVPVDLGDEDDVIPIIRDGKFENSGIQATRDGSDEINEYQFPAPISIPPAIQDDQAVRKDQLSEAASSGNHSDLNLDDGTNPHGTTKGDIGLSNVDNTSDLDKPISNATQSALDAKAPLIEERVIPFIWVWDGTSYVDIPTGGDGETWLLQDLINVISWRGDGYSPIGNQVVYPSVDGTRINLWEGTIDPQIGDEINMTLRYIVQ